MARVRRVWRQWRHRHDPGPSYDVWLYRMRDEIGMTTDTDPTGQW